MYAKLHIIDCDNDCDYSIAVYFDGTVNETLSHDWQLWADANLAFHALVDDVAVGTWVSV